MFKAEDEAKEAQLKYSKLEAVVEKLRQSQEGAARELVEAQTKAREDAAALEKAKEKANHYRAEADAVSEQLTAAKQQVAGEHGCYPVNKGIMYHRCITQVHHKRCSSDWALWVLMRVLTVGTPRQSLHTAVATSIWPQPH